MAVKALNIRILQRFNHKIYSSFLKASCDRPGILWWRDHWNSLECRRLLQFFEEIISSHFWHRIVCQYHIHLLSINLPKQLRIYKEPDHFIRSDCYEMKKSQLKQTRTWSNSEIDTNHGCCPSAYKEKCKWCPQQGTKFGWELRLLYQLFQLALKLLTQFLLPQPNSQWWGSVTVSGKK